MSDQVIDLVARAIAALIFIAFVLSVLTGSTGENEWLMDWVSNGRGRSQVHG